MIPLRVLSGSDGPYGPEMVNPGTESGPPCSGPQRGSHGLTQALGGREELAKSLGADLKTALEDLGDERALTLSEGMILMAVACWLRGLPTPWEDSQPCP